MFFFSSVFLVKPVEKLKKPDVPKKIDQSNPSFPPNSFPYHPRTAHLLLTPSPIPPPLRRSLARLCPCLRPWDVCLPRFLCLRPHARLHPRTHLRASSSLTSALLLHPRVARLLLAPPLPQLPKRSPLRLLLAPSLARPTLPPRRVLLLAPPPSFPCHGAEPVRQCRWEDGKIWRHSPSHADTTPLDRDPTAAAAHHLAASPLHRLQLHRSFSCLCLPVCFHSSTQAHHLPAQMPT